jgi:hypothetical protein
VRERLEDAEREVGAVGRILLAGSRLSHVRDHALKVN